MNGVLLLTGATGYLGTQIARRVLTDTNFKLIVLVRGRSDEAAKRRLKREWWPWPETRGPLEGRVRVLAGDISEHKLGLREEDYNSLTKEVTHIIHTAADLRLNGPIEDMRRTNVAGTANVVELALAAHADHGLARLSHVSTAYVSGGRTGLVKESDLYDKHGFYNTYEATKYEAERLVRESAEVIPTTILRPGMIVGDSNTGEIRKFNTIYYPLRQYLRGHLPILPVSSSTRLNIIPVDYVADSVLKATLSEDAKGSTLHLISPHDSQPTIGELLKNVRDWARDKPGLDAPGIIFIPTPTPRPSSVRLTASSKSNDGLIGKLGELRPYLIERKFTRENTDRLLGSYTFNWREAFPHLLNYALYHGFLHPEPRTVHEQILHRLEGRSMPVTVSDFLDGNVIPRDSAKLRSEMMQAAEALRSMGITEGDRVAIVGLNSSRYLTLDVAIGLVGAVSVPLYYTSPPSEIRELVTDCGAKLLLIGAPNILQNLGELGIPVVSFCRNEPDCDLKGITNWADFIEREAGADTPDSPANFEEAATIRYTSGTTGKPKGVCFTHGGLRWIGEAVCSLFPWKTRSGKITYLSFLPMNHVVEGIIGAYSPFYAPTSLDIVYLEDFHSLREALPRVKPTIFFSVPRFYERVCEALRSSSIGATYLGSRGLLRTMLRPFVRRGLLKNAGLERCRQLIAGSAPMSAGVLRELGELGVEVYNAYGLTEAPLVSMNLPGRNRVGTVGEALPETIMKVAEDGEILVKGPQVTTGYVNSAADPCSSDGFFSTGDLGRIENGYLIIDGRKKELFKTSYGKYIQPAKLESMLREIGCAEEVMAIGDNRPYCTALIWVKKNVDKAHAEEEVSRRVAEINERLSHPEQIRRWALLENDLSISGGDLTANLKLKRRAILARFSKVVDGLYTGHDSVVPQGVS